MPDDGNRYEVIDGELYVAASPSSIEIHRRDEAGELVFEKSLQQGIN